MKRIFILANSILFASLAFGQQTDPTLTATVAAQTVVMDEIHDKRKSIQEKIIAAEATVTLALDRVHSVEDKMLSYLSNASSAMQNLYQVKRCVELVGDEIPKNIELLTNSIPGHLKGTAIAALVSDEIRDVYAQMTSLAPFMYQLVTSGTYNVTNPNGENEKHKVNLLNAAERYYIANEIVHRLETINVDLFLLAWQVRTYDWNRLWFSLDPAGWAAVMSGKNRVQMVIGKVSSD